MFVAVVAAVVVVVVGVLAIGVDGLFWEGDDFATWGLLGERNWLFALLLLLKLFGDGDEIECCKVGGVLVATFVTGDCCCCCSNACCCCCCCCSNACCCFYSLIID